MPITRLEDVFESRLTWPEAKPRAAHRTGSPFRTEVERARREIESELGRWGVRRFIVSRNNQRIFAGDPGAAVWWEDKKRELRVLACDKYQKLADNLHAIALTLGAMRALERWGAYTLEQAAEGARPAALPPPAAPPEDWRSVFGEPPGNVARFEQLAVINARYRQACVGANGDQGQLTRLNLAIEAARKELT